MGHKRFRPAILCASAALTHGGSETYAMGLCRYLADMGRIKFAAGRSGSAPLTGDFKELTRHPNVRSITFPVLSRQSAFAERVASSPLSSKINSLDIESLGLLPALFRLRGFFADVDVLEVNYALESIIFPFLSPGMKKIIHFHGPWLSPVVNRLKRFLSRYVTMGITCSRWAAGELERSWPGLHVEVVHNGVDTGEFRPLDHVSSFPVSEKYNDRILKVGTVARLSRNKGTDLLFRAAREMQGRAEFFLVGSPDAGFREELSSYGGLDNFHLLGPVDNRDLPRFYNFIDCFVLPTLFENFPITVLESMACGLPVISTCVGGIPEMVENGKNGILISPGDVKELINAIEYVEAYRQRAHEMGLNAIATVKENFTMEHSFAGTRRIYESLMEGIMK